MVLKQVATENFTNAAAADLAAATPTWEIRPNESDNRNHGNPNIIWVFNDSDEKLQLKFDGDDNDYVIIFPKVTFGTNIEDGLSFRFVDLTNLSATDPAVNEVRVRISTIRDVQGRP